MVVKKIPWNTGNGNIKITYMGIGNESISIESDTENDNFEERSQVITFETTKGTPIQIKSLTIYQSPKEVPVGTIYNYDYTGTVQQVTLPKGKYKLQCWGAQGGSVTGTYSATGSKGGYSEGVISLTQTTTLYIFVGGKGSDISTSNTSGIVNGGWNGGGGASKKTSYNSGDTYGESFPRAGGGATDIALVASDMSYNNYRNNRSNDSLLSRCIVAGGGAGASARYTEVTTEEESYVLKNSSTNSINKIYNYQETVTDIKKTDSYYYNLNSRQKIYNQYYFVSEVDIPIEAKQLEMRFEKSTGGGLGVEFRNSNGSVTGTFSNTTQPSGTKIKVDIPTGTTSMIFSYLNEAGVEYQSSQPFDGIIFYKSIYYKQYDINVQNYAGNQVRLECEGGTNANVVRYYILKSNDEELSTEFKNSSNASWDITLPSNAATLRVQAQNRKTTDYPTYLHTSFYVKETTTSTDTSSSKSNSLQQGGGVSGKGVTPGTQTNGGGDFGLGANQITTNYRYASGGGGGGWYGGGSSHSDSSTNQINSSGGGSGFVNTAANADNRPSGYAGLQLDSGSTKDGATSFPSPNGDNETGHSGNGYARITKIE